jgi:acyl carrier protein
LITFDVVACARDRRFGVTDSSASSSPDLEHVMSFLLDALLAMNYDVDKADADTVLGPAGIDLESLAVVELSFRIEDAYGARFNEEDMEGLGRPATWSAGSDPVRPS